MSGWEEAGIGALGAVRRTTSNGPEAIALVENELSRLLYGRKARNRYNVPCPFHISDSGFSRTLNVNLNPNRTNSVGFNVPVGYYHCWSCNASGPWNRLANHLGLQQLEETDNPDIISGLASIAWDEEYVRPDETLLSDVTDDWVRDDCTIFRETLEDFDVHAYQKILNRGGDYEIYNKLWLPAWMNHQLVGHVEVRLDEEDPEEKYMNSPGPWSHRNWIGFDQVRRYFGNEYVAIVEGPADFLRCVQNSIPALPMLGVQSYSKTKRVALEMAFKHIIAIGDGDEAGERMKTTVLDSIPSAFGINLPKDADPASLTKSELKELKRMIERKVRR